MEPNGVIYTGSVRTTVNEEMKSFGCFKDLFKTLKEAVVKANVKCNLSEPIDGAYPSTGKFVILSHSESFR